jgi:hypothetical protein
MVNVDGRDVIKIEVGRHMIDDPNKGAMPIPEFPWRALFDLEVTFVEPAGGLMLTLSDFKIVSYDPEAAGTGEDPHWRPTNIEMEVKDENGENLQEISFASSEGVQETRKTESGEEKTVYGIGKTVEFWKDERVEGLNLHVVFKQTLSGVLFEIDPPWAGKPPTG